MRERNARETQPTVTRCQRDPHTQNSAFFCLTNAIISHIVSLIYVISVKGVPFVRIPQALSSLFCAPFFRRRSKSKSNLPIFRLFLSTCLFANATGHPLLFVHCTQFQVRFFYTLAICTKQRNLTEFSHLEGFSSSFNRRIQSKRILSGKERKCSLHSSSVAARPSGAKQRRFCITHRQKRAHSVRSRR